MAFLTASFCLLTSSWCSFLYLAISSSLRVSAASRFFRLSFSSASSALLCSSRSLLASSSYSLITLASCLASASFSRRALSSFCLRFSSIWAYSSLASVFFIFSWASNSLTSRSWKPRVGLEIIVYFSFGAPPRNWAKLRSGLTRCAGTSGDCCWSVALI